MCQEILGRLLYCQMSGSKATIDVHDIEDLQEEMDPEPLACSTRYSSDTEATSGDLRYKVSEALTRICRLIWCVKYRDGRARESPSPTSETSYPLSD